MYKGHSCIFHYPKVSRKFTFSVTRKGTTCSKSFNSLEEAIEFKKKWEKDPSILKARPARKRVSLPKTNMIFKPHNAGELKEINECRKEQGLFPVDKNGRVIRTDI